MGYAFISYSSKNHTYAEIFRKILINNKIEMWMAPYSIPAGSKYAQEISRAIKECSCFVLLMTNEAQESVWVAKEIERAINYRKRIITIQTEDVRLNDEFELYISSDQIVKLNNIDENSYEIKSVISDIASCLGNDKTDKGETSVGKDTYKSEIRSEKDSYLNKTLDDKYFITGYIGDDGFSYIYTAIDKIVNIPVVIKILYASPDKQKNYLKNHKYVDLSAEERASLKKSSKEFKIKLIDYKFSKDCQYYVFSFYSGMTDLLSVYKPFNLHYISYIRYSNGRCLYCGGDYNNSNPKKCRICGEEIVEL